MLGLLPSKRRLKTKRGVKRASIVYLFFLLPPSCGASLGTGVTFLTWGASRSTRGCGGRTISILFSGPFGTSDPWFEPRGDTARPGSSAGRTGCSVWTSRGGSGPCANDPAPGGLGSAEGTVTRPTLAGWPPGESAPCAPATGSAGRTRTFWPCGAGAKRFQPGCDAGGDSWPPSLGPNTLLSGVFPKFAESSNAASF